VKTWLIKKGYSNTLLVDPLQASAAAADIDKARENMRDAVHMKPAGFSRVADKIKEMAKGWMLNRKRPGEVGTEPDSKRARVDQNQGRGGDGGKGGCGGGGKGGTRAGAAGSGRGGPHSGAVGVSTQFLSLKLLHN
jgi:hypothetical protein